MLDIRDPFTNLADFLNIVQTEGGQTYVLRKSDFVNAFWHKIGIDLTQNWHKNTL